MQDLQVIGVESGALARRLRGRDAVSHPHRRCAAAPSCARPYRSPATAPRLSPREIQAHIRSGMSAQDVAGLTGAPLEYIQRFEGPVIAEREFVVAVRPRRARADGRGHRSARRGQDIRHSDPGASARHSAPSASAGRAGRRRQAAGSSSSPSRPNHIDHDARWQFDPKKHSLVPLNTEAISLSQQGEAAAPLQPAPASRGDRAGGHQPLRQRRLRHRRVRAADRRARRQAERRSDGCDDEPVHGNQTADLLEALRRRRGERESANFDDDSRAAHPSTGSIHIVEVPADDPAEQTPGGSRTTQPQPRLRKGRAVDAQLGRDRVRGPPR